VHALRNTPVIVHDGIFLKGSWEGGFGGAGSTLRMPPPAARDGSRALAFKGTAKEGLFSRLIARRSRSRGMHARKGTYPVITYMLPCYYLKKRNFLACVSKPRLVVMKIKISFGACKLFNCI
jgi:hypothetical protein